jgi:hypothetical protein
VTSDSPYFHAIVLCVSCGGGVWACLGHNPAPPPLIFDKNNLPTTLPFEVVSSLLRTNVYSLATVRKMLFPFVLNIIPWSLGIGEYEFRASNCDQWILQACYWLDFLHELLLQTIMTDYDTSMVPTEAGVERRLGMSTNYPLASLKWHFQKLRSAPFHFLTPSSWCGCRVAHSGNISHWRIAFTLRTGHSL